MRLYYSITLLLILFLSITPRTSAAINIILPTGNTAILNGDDSSFYQHTTTARDDPWAGGSYGYVRNPRQTKSGMIFTRFHEGIDIKPLYRDEKGRPLDSVMAIDKGRVVHVNALAGRSNYGKYIVVEHIWDGSPYYSLYAHLNEVWVDSGQVVQQGDLIGRLGYTGVGINKARAHLHFEIGLLLNENFQQWYESFYSKESNYNGIFNGQNIAGLNVARLYLALAACPDVSIAEFLAEEDAFFKLRIPVAERIDLLSRYPWLLQAPADVMQLHASWDLYFTRSGLPLRIIPSSEEVFEPVALREQELAVTCRFIRGREVCELTDWGYRYLRLLTATSEEIVSDGNDPKFKK
jgi:murein DD-endopeptidase MepM/ murein hydrolase activator NlpD